MSKQDSQETTPLPYGKRFSQTRLAIETLAKSIGDLEYRQKGLPEPEHTELLRIARQRYRSSIEHGDDNHLGTAKRVTQ